MSKSETAITLSLNRPSSEEPRFPAREKMHRTLAPRRKSSPSMRQASREVVLVLQCLSTFFVPGSDELSMVAFRMVSDYTNLSLSRVQNVLRRLEQQGYVAIWDRIEAARLDPDTWERRAAGQRMFFYAYFVSHAPQALRDRDSLQPVWPCSCPVDFPERDPGCSTTVATNFDGVYNSITNREFCCPPPRTDPREFIFEARLCVCPDESVALNLWYLASAFADDPLILFRRELLVLYSSGCDGRSGMDWAEAGQHLVICMNDVVLEDESSEALLAVACEPPRQEGHRDCLRCFRTLSGLTLTLDSLYGVAYYGSSAARLYQERGRAACGAEIVELAGAGTGCHSKRHDALATVRGCCPP